MLEYRVRDPKSLFLFLFHSTLGSDDEYLEFSLLHDAPPLELPNLFLRGSAAHAGTTRKLTKRVGLVLIEYENAQNPRPRGIAQKFTEEIFRHGGIILSRQRPSNVR